MTDTIEERIQKTRQNMLQAGWEYLGNGLYVPGPELKARTNWKVSKEQLYKTFSPFMTSEERADIFPGCQNT